MKQYRYLRLFSLKHLGALCIALLIGQSNYMMAAIKVACVGDSITAGDGSTAGNHYPDQLAAKLGSAYIVGNYGASGYTMLKKGNLPYWNHSNFINSANFGPDIVVIMLGSNDSKSQNWVYKAEFSADYKAMIAYYRNLPNRPQVFINTCPTVYGAGVYGITDAVVTGEVVPLIKQIGLDTGCEVIDVNAATKNMAANFPDTVHPNNTGAGVIATTVYNAIISGPVTDGTYYLQSRATGKVLDNQGSTTDGTDVTQWTNGANNNQKWVVKYSGGFYTFACITGGKRLDSLSHTTNDSSVGQWASGASRNQQWKLVPTDSGYYKLASRANLKCLDTTGLTANASILKFWDEGTSVNQQWRFVTP